MMDEEQRDTNNRKNRRHKHQSWGHEKSVEKNEQLNGSSSEYILNLHNEEDFDIDNDKVLQAVNYEDTIKDGESKIRSMSRSPISAPKTSDFSSSSSSDSSIIESKPKQSTSKYISRYNSNSKLKHRHKLKKVTTKRVKPSLESDVSNYNEDSDDFYYYDPKLKSKDKPKNRKRLSTTPEVGLDDDIINSSLPQSKPCKIPAIRKEKVKPPVFIDKRISPKVKYDIDIKNSYWEGVPLKVFQDKDVANLLELSEEYILNDFFLNPTAALRQWILHDQDKCKYLPCLAGKTIAYDTDLSGFQAKALQDAFNASNISTTQVKECNNHNCPTKPSLSAITLNIILAKQNIIVDNNITEKQGIKLIQQTGGPVYCKFVNSN